MTKDEYLLMLETGGMQCRYPCLALVDWNSLRFCFAFSFFWQVEDGVRYEFENQIEMQQEKPSQKSVTTSAIQSNDPNSQC